MPTTINRTAFNALIDDDGSNTVGSPWNKSAIAATILDAIDAIFTRSAASGETLLFQNTLANANAYAAVLVGTDAQASNGLYAFSSLFPTSGPNVQNGVALVSVNAGGISYSAQHASGEHRWYSGGTTERMRLISNGDLGIGVSPSAGNRLIVRGADATSAATAILVQNSTPTNLLQIRNDGLITTGTAALSPTNNTTATPVNTYVHTDGVLYRSTSSARYKDQIEAFTGGLDELLALWPKTFIAKGRPDMGRYLGFISEEVAEQLPYAVTYSKDGPENYDARGVLACLPNALRDIVARLKALEAR